MNEPPGPPTRAGVAATYARIAAHFAETRARPWPAVARFVSDGDPVERALDLGCGNGRHLPLLREVAEAAIGLDLSRALLEVAADTHRDVDLLLGDVVDLPVCDDAIDLCLYVATIHHLPSATERARSLAELDRVLRPGGKALVSAWSVSHEKFDAERGHDRWVDWTLPNGDVVPRFYHVFDLAEFTAEVEASAAAVDRTFERDGNCYAVVRGQ